MPRGRKPKPTVLKVLAGNPGKRPLNPSEPKPLAEAPRCPTWLDAEGKRKWKALVPELERLGLLTIVDGDTLAGYCQACAEFKFATEILKQEGRVCRVPVMGKEDGEVKVIAWRLSSHPAVHQQRSALALIRAFAALFGLDPSSRSRLSSPVSSEFDDPAEAFFRKA